MLTGAFLATRGFRARKMPMTRTQRRILRKVPKYR
jgi:hypothetical protein